MGLVECKGRLKSILDTLEESIDSDKRNLKSPEEGRQKFIKMVNDEIKEYVTKDHLPVSYTSVLDGGFSIRIANHQIERDFFSDNPLINYIGFPEAYSALVYRNISQTYTNQIKLNSPRKKYYIDYFEIQDALNTLCLNRNYTIISLGIELHDSMQQTVPKENIHIVRTRYSELLIIPTAECPSLTLMENPVTIEINPIPNSSKDNIQAIVPYLYNQQNFIHYVLLKIVFRDYEGIPSQLDEIEPIQMIL